MHLSRRSFSGSALGLALGSRLAAPAFAQQLMLRPDHGIAAALSAIRAFGQADREYNFLPGMTLGVLLPGGQRTILNFGYADADRRTPIGSDTLFQIGSITKLMIAALFHQFAAEGRLRLTDLVSERLPNAPLPAGNRVEVQHLLDHVAGLPADAPLSSRGGLWLAYPPGDHWHYSNSGYEILGKLAEYVSGLSIAELLRQRIFTPLGMSRSKGAIVETDRALYAKGFEAADQLVPYVRGAPLKPAPWVNVTSAEMCAASTADDMMALLLALASAVQGKGGLGLSPQQARGLVSHAVATDFSGLSYGNGLMHVEDGGRSYLHHTGGMLSFSSSFHVDLASGVGAFASAPLNAFAEYRPRLLTQFAVDALTNALGGRPLPQPPAIAPLLTDVASYVGHYAGPAGSFELVPGSPLTIIAGGQSAPLELWSAPVFRTAHPQFRRYSLMFERSHGLTSIANWGPHSYARQGSGASLPRSDPALARFAGNYVSDDPWFGPAPVVERGGRLWLGTETPMTYIGDNLWRVGKESWSPERGSFEDFVHDRPQTFVLSAVNFSRRNV